MSTGRYTGPLGRRSRRADTANRPAFVGSFLDRGTQMTDTPDESEPEAPVDDEYELWWGPDASPRSRRLRSGVPDPDPMPSGVGQLVPDGPVSEAPAPPIPVPEPATVTLSRRTFRLGLTAAVVVIGLLVVLWQRGGGDSAGRAGPTPDPSTDDPHGQAAVSDDPGAEDGTGPAAALQADLAALGSEVADLEAELAAVVPPAVPGSALRRIVVAADASFVSLGNQGLAVIGPFGGYAAVDPATNTVTATAQVAGGATRVMRTSAAVWITNYIDDEIVRIDPVGNRVEATLSFPGPDGIAKLGPTLVVASFDEGFVAQVDPASGEILQRADGVGQPSDIVVSGDDTTIWVAIFDTGEVVAIDAADFTVRERVTVGAGPVGLALVDDVLWVANNGEGSVAAVDTAAPSLLGTVPVGAGPTAVAGYVGSVWVSVTEAGELVELDPVSYEIVTRTPLGASTRGGPSGMTVGADSLWVAMQGERSVVRVTLDGG